MKVYQPEKVHRIILKISGEFLAGPKRFGFDHDTLENLIDDIVEIKRLGLRIGIVIGGGNIFRGVEGAENSGIERVTGDNVGMLATVQNALVVSDYLKRRNILSEVYSAFKIDRIVKFYTPNRALTSFQEGKVCFFCGGTGNPFFTTDTAAVLRAIELKVNLVMKGTKVNGIYSADPVKDKKAVFIEDITYDEVLAKKLNVMDMTAFSLARENDINMKIFNVGAKGQFKEAVLKNNVGTFVHN
ncbi:MAG: UMP kinase [Candidatus Cloacimonadota bacterium]|nr:MAG: UMP kinase [Candidatus Cloacimonadota bacterium]